MVAEGKSSEKGRLSLDLGSKVAIWVYDIGFEV